MEMDTAEAEEGVRESGGGKFDKEIKQQICITENGTENTVSDNNTHFAVPFRPPRPPSLSLLDDLLRTL